MGKEIIASRCFTLADQLEFARLSDDHNPMHIDAIAARRTQAGAPVVHGVHAVIWALDALAARQQPVDRIANLSVRFAKFMYLDTPVDIALVQQSETALTIELITERQSALTLTARLSPVRPPAKVTVPAGTAEITTAGTRPNTMSFEELAGLSRWLAPAAGSDEWARAFPSAAGALTATRLAGLGQLSRLVGMISPGLHSIFSGFAVDLADDVPDRPGLGFTVTTADPRYRIVKMDVAGSGLSGTVSTFMRQPPVEPPTVAALSSQLSPSECAGSTALLVGASRGLGAITAKLLTAGGGKAIVTYARGRDDAEKLAEEINAVHGAGACTTLALDVRSGVAAQLAPLTAPITHFYYFATPQIFRQKSALFSPALYEEFSRFYVHAFFEAIEFLSAQPRRGVLPVFYPSSVAVESRPAGMTEYAMAKIAGEFLCADLNRSIPQISILVSRLPRMLTDQTATIAEVKTADPVAAMLALIREIHAHQRAA
jgi:hypothetical protein